MFGSGNDLDITINKEVLIGILNTNLMSHQAEFEHAWAAYQKAAVEWFEECLVAAKNGKPTTRQMPHPKPENHAGDYEQIIGMLKHHTKGTIELDWQMYRQFVDDTWDWSAAWESTNTYYMQEK